jgi:FG-GAP repeat
MRRMAWFVAVVAAVAHVMVPGPDFNNDGFGDLAVGVPARTSAPSPVFGAAFS